MNSTKLAGIIAVYRKNQGKHAEKYCAFLCYNTQYVFA